MRNLMKLVIFSVILAQIALVYGQGTSPKPQPPLTSRHFSSDGVDYIGLWIKLPTKPDKVSQLPAPACLADNIIGLESFGGQVQKGTLKVSVFGFASDDNQRYCADLTNTSFGTIMRQVAEGEATIKVDSLPAANLKRVTVSKTSKTPKDTFFENTIIYIERKRIWVIDLIYSGADADAKNLAREILAPESIKIENMRP